MRSRTTLAVLVAALITLAALPGSTFAAFVPWTNANGSNANFSWSSGGSTDGLWGDPVVSDTTFTFSPQNFRAQSNNGIATTVDGLLQFNLDIAPGQSISGITINESGFYSILGLGSVNASGLLVVRDRDTLNEYTDTLDTAPAMPVSNAVNPFGNVNGGWTGVMAVVLPNGVTRLTIIADNNLQAQSVAGGGAIPGSTSFIDKKSANVVIGVIVPEPSMVGLLLCGAPLLLRRRRA